MGTTLDQAPSDESFGIENVFLRERDVPITSEVFCRSPDTNHASGLSKTSNFQFATNDGSIPYSEMNTQCTDKGFCRPRDDARKCTYLMLLPKTG